jgi:hypothetical protein
LSGGDCRNYNLEITEFSLCSSNTISDCDKFARHNLIILHYHYVIIVNT